MASNRDDSLSYTNNLSLPCSPITASDLLEPYYLPDPSSSLFGSASNSYQNDSVLLTDSTTTSGSDAEFGFSRPDFRQSPLAGTVQLYHRHVFLCYKNPSVWPPRIEAAEFDRLPRLLSAAVTARKADMKNEMACSSGLWTNSHGLFIISHSCNCEVSEISKQYPQTRLTICEGHDGTETSNGDVLIFPDMIRYRRLTHFDVDTFVEEVLVKDGEWLPGTPEKLKGSYVFVCSHGSRDRRCGVCGPALVSRFEEEIELHGLQGKVSVSPCSHIGGHKYAGNVIIFGSSFEGAVTGHWYGYVTPDDIQILLEQHIGKGEIVDRLWRGQMGLSEEEQIKNHELRLQQNGGTTENSKEITQRPVDKSNTSSSRSEVVSTGCCQQNGSSSCCQNPVLPEKDIVDANERTAKVTPEKKKNNKKKPLSRINSSKGSSARKVCAMPTWFESWERDDTYAALAVVCAVVSVAVAYKCYRQL